MVRYCTTATIRLVLPCGRFTSGRKILALSPGVSAVGLFLSARAGAILRRMKVEEIAEAIAKLPPDQLARFRHWFSAFEAGRADHAKELDSTATKLGRLAGRAFAELKKRANEP